MAKKKSAAAAQKLVKITFKCVSGTCEVLPKNVRRVHLSPGDQVALVADNTDVVVNFDLASPFISGLGYPSNNPIRIPQGTTFPTQTVSYVTGTFSYNYACDNCAAGVDNPEMVVP